MSATAPHRLTLAIVLGVLVLLGLVSPLFATRSMSGTRTSPPSVATGAPAPSFVGLSTSAPPRGDTPGFHVWWGEVQRHADGTLRLTLRLALRGQQPYTSLAATAEVVSRQPGAGPWPVTVSSAPPAGRLPEEFELVFDGPAVASPRADLGLHVTLEFERERFLGRESMTVQATYALPEDGD